MPGIRGVSRVRSGPAASKPRWKERKGKLLPRCLLLTLCAELLKGKPFPGCLFSQLQEQLSCWFESRYQQGTFLMPELGPVSAKRVVKNWNISA